MPSPAIRPVVLIVRDGWGHNPYPEMNDCNAVYLADTPVNDRLLEQYPVTQIKTSGEDVGLPDGVMGNSEVGHQNIGAGRIVDQELMRITRLIRDGSFFQNAVINGAIDHAQERGSTVHVLGLVSDGGVHSHIDHIISVLDLCARRGLKSDQVAVHVITDGRDTSPQLGLKFVETLEQAIERFGVGRIVDVVGRFYAMDRDNRWDRVVKAYQLLTQGAENVFPSAREAIEDYYQHPTTESMTGDEFIAPRSVSATGAVSADQLVKSGDSLIFCNYRGDRPRELTKAFVFDDADWKNIKGGGFDRGARLDDLYFATMTAYEEGLPVKVIYEKPPKMVNILGDYIESLGFKQFRCAESEKHPHVTFFFNDYRKACFHEEFQLEIPSPRHVSTYDLLPEMSAAGVTNAVVNAVQSDLFDFILVNFANCDMVGHTGKLDAAIKAVEMTDECVGRVIDAVLQRKGAIVVTADHGNSEQMVDPETGGPHTKHTTYDVDVIVVDERQRGRTLRSGGRLADIAPTVLDLMGLPVPNEMTGKSLLDAE